MNLFSQNRNKLNFILLLLFVSFSTIAQENQLFKDMIKESIKLELNADDQNLFLKDSKNILKENNLPDTKLFYPKLSVILDPLNLEEKPNYLSKEKISPNLTIPFTNEGKDLSFDEYWKKQNKYSQSWRFMTPVDGKWSSPRPPGGSVSGTFDFFSKENWRSTIRKKEALQKIKKAYGITD